MKEWTGIEISRAHQSLEHSSALVLGRMLLEFSRLDVALGLSLVWSNEGKQLESLTPEVESLTFHQKLERLEKLVVAKFAANQEVQPLYTQWLRSAHVIRQIRNELVHGRWGIEPTKGHVINVIGLPTSPDQRTTAYTIQELKHQLDEMEKLRERLSELCGKWPV